jgi:outer membrane protein insertion porin family
MKVSGVSLGLGRRLNWPDNYFTLYNELSYQRYKLNDFAQGGYVFATGTSRNINFTTVFGRNSVDSPLYPRRGTNISLSLTLTPPYSLFKEDDFWKLSEAESEGLTPIEIDDIEDAEHYKWIEYHKWKFKSDWYTQIVEKLVLRTNIEFGYLGSYNKNVGDSPFESFQLGGDGMSGSNYIYGSDIVPLRGYDNGRYSKGSITALPQANVFSKYVMEVRYPLTLNPSATIYALVFAEAGNSWNSIDEFSPFNAYRAAGVGLRFWLPMFGLLGVDLGYGFDPIFNQPGSNGSQFAFTIGQQF